MSELTKEDKKKIFKNLEKMYKNSNSDTSLSKIRDELEDKLDLDLKNKESKNLIKEYWGKIENGENFEEEEDEVLVKKTDKKRKLDTIENEEKGKTPNKVSIKIDPNTEEE
jgi:hypothetical protein